jgi:phage terminase large subunit-like protein
MTGYEQYINDVELKKIVTCEYIKLAVKRFKKFQNRDDIYFDAEKVNEVIEFISLIKHYLGKHSGKSFILQPWQEFITACIFGFYYKENHKRVTRNVFILMARKQGKSAFASAISLYMLLAEGESSPEIVFAANSREQAKIILDITTQFAKSLDPKEKSIKIYRNEIKYKTNNGKIKVVSADASKLDGMNLNYYCIDELHAAKDSKMLDVLSSSQGMRENPLSLVVSTAGFSLLSPCYSMFQTSIEILRDIKIDDSFMSFIYTLDENDNWQLEKNFIKSNPNLDITVTSEFIKDQIQKAKNNTSEEIGVRTKVLNQWCSSSETWIPYDLIAKYTQKIDLEKFRGLYCTVGVDLAQVSDLTAVTVYINDEKNDVHYFKTYYYLPLDVLQTHQQKELYKKWHYEKQIIMTDGCVTDYRFITEDLFRINAICPISTIFYDSYNSTTWAIDATEQGLNLMPYSQSLSSYNKPTKTFELFIKSGKIIVDDNQITRFCFSNVVLKYDHNENVKPFKSANKNKIDGVISILTALGGALTIPKVDNTIFTF